MTPAAQAVPSRSLPILVVDDDSSLRTLMQEGLSQLGYQVELAANVAEARGRLRSRAYSLVLCDYEMPGESGLDLLGYVTAVYPCLPFIMLTAHDEAELACGAIASGALDFLSKPFQIRNLARRIEQNRARLDRDREQAAQLTNEMLAGTIRALVAAVDAKDPHTAHHSARVSRLALCLGASLGYTADQLRVLEFAALLHDVGKIGVPEEILRKPAGLTDAEWNLMRQHPVRSAEIVGEVRPLAEVATIVRHHHERVDGSGYPDGLSGEAIPAFSRIISLADAYEAMTSDRAYRPARDPQEARNNIRKCLETQFDPKFGEAFLKIRRLP